MDWCPCTSTAASTNTCSWFDWQRIAFVSTCTQALALDLPLFLVVLIALILVLISRCCYRAPSSHNSSDRLLAHVVLARFVIALLFLVILQLALEMAMDSMVADDWILMVDACVQALLWLVILSHLRLSLTKPVQTLWLQRLVRLALLVQLVVAIAWIHSAVLLYAARIAQEPRNDAVQAVHMCRFILALFTVPHILFGLDGVRTTEHAMHHDPTLLALNTSINEPALSNHVVAIGSSSSQSIWSRFINAGNLLKNEQHGNEESNNPFADLIEEDKSDAANNPFAEDEDAAQSASHAVALKPSTIPVPSTTAAQIALQDVEISVTSYQERTELGRSVVQYQLVAVLRQAAVICDDPLMNTCSVWKRWREFEGMHDSILETARMHSLSPPRLPIQPKGGNAAQLTQACTQLTQYLNALTQHSQFLDDLGQFIAIEDKLKDLIDFRAKQALQRDLQAAEDRANLKRMHRRDEAKQSKQHETVIAGAVSKSADAPNASIKEHASQTQSQPSRTWHIFSVGVSGVARWLSAHDGSAYFTFEVVVNAIDGSYKIFRRANEVMEFRSALLREIKQDSAALASSMPTCALLSRIDDELEDDVLNQQCHILEIFLQSLSATNAFQRPLLALFLARRRSSNVTSASVLKDPHLFSGCRPHSTYQLNVQKWLIERAAVSTESATTDNVASGGGHKRLLLESEVSGSRNTLFPELNAHSSASRVPDAQLTTNVATPVGNNLHRFVAYVPSYEQVTVEKNQKPTLSVIYLIVIREYYDRDGFLEWSVRRRYNEFVTMHKVLRAMFAQYDFPDLPPKSSLTIKGKSSNSPEQLEERRALLELYIQRIINVTAFQVDEFFSFFDLNNSERDMRMGNDALAS